VRFIATKMASIVEAEAEKSLTVGSNSGSDIALEELVEGFTNQKFRGKKDILLQILTNKAAEHLDSFDEKSLKSLFTLSFKLLKLSSESKISAHASIVNLCLALVSNLTKTEENSQIFLDSHVVINEPEDGSSPTVTMSAELAFAMESFLSYNSQVVEPPDDSEAEQPVMTEADWAAKDEWQHMSSVLCNVVRLVGGRRVLVRRSTGYMEKLVRQIRSRNPTRRRGAVGSLRTVLFDKDVHWWILFDVGALPYIMLPLVVATPFTDKEKAGMDPILFIAAENPAKKWEPEEDILLMLLECVILLCQRRALREELRKRRVYYICRNLDYLQENETASNLILDIVNLLMRDEDPDTPMEDGDTAATRDGGAVGISAGGAKADNAKEVSASAATPNVAARTETTDLDTVD
jgi:Domain of unknown function (DUF383)/Domain of unknown function (DUF384)